MLVSNWEVETNSAFFLTTNFIKAYNSGLDTSEVLRQTIIKLKKDEKYHHSYFWGSFNLVGDGEIILIINYSFFTINSKVFEYLSFSIKYSNRKEFWGICHLNF